MTCALTPSPIFGFFARTITRCAIAMIIPTRRAAWSPPNFARWTPMTERLNVFRGLLNLTDRQLFVVEKYAEMPEIFAATTLTWALLVTIRQLILARPAALDPFFVETWEVIPKRPVETPVTADPSITVATTSYIKSVNAALAPLLPLRPRAQLTLRLMLRVMLPLMLQAVPRLMPLLRAQHLARLRIQASPTLAAR